MTEMRPLRRRMIEDMTVRNLSLANQRSYVHAVAKFRRFFGRAPEWLRGWAWRRYVPSRCTSLLAGYFGGSSSKCVGRARCM
jgi:hypothetical protein